MRRMTEYAFQEKRKISAMIKDGVDNLPGGVSFFDGRGVPVLVNRTMHTLIFRLTGRDVQDISDLDEIMKTPSEVRPGDGTVWQFQKRIVDEKSGLVEITASEITELLARKRELEKGNEEQHKVMERLEQISRDVVAITRSEEILAMKMRVHSELGFALSATRHFITSGSAGVDKKTYIERQRRMVQELLLQIDSDDEPDAFPALKRTAERLGMEIVCEEEIPELLEGILTKVVRECLVNAVRHGGGDKVFVKCRRESCGEGDMFVAAISDNGRGAREERITEGGGLGSLRKEIEQAGGSMRVDTGGSFTVTVMFPAAGDCETLKKTGIKQQKNRQTEVTV